MQTMLEYQILIENILEGTTDLAKDGLFLPSFGENMQFMFQYQLNWMYWRYFMWNFPGRQTMFKVMG